jgi:hypothetical protein
MFLALGSTQTFSLALSLSLSLPRSYQFSRFFLNLYISDKDQNFFFNIFNIGILFISQKPTQYDISEYSSLSYCVNINIIISSNIMFFFYINRGIMGAKGERELFVALLREQIYEGCQGKDGAVGGRKKGLQ